MIYIFVLYPLLIYKFLVGKDSDSSSSVVQGLKQLSVIIKVFSYASYFSPKKKKSLHTFLLSYLLPLHLSPPTTTIIFPSLISLKNKTNKQKTYFKILQDSYLSWHWQVIRTQSIISQQTCSQCPVPPWMF